MPYHDPLRPFVSAWYGSSEGSNVTRLVDTLSERNQDRLEEEGGACVIYTHFGHGYVRDAGLHARFKQLMTRLSRKNGWFVPVSTLLDYLARQRDDHTITDQQRRLIEQRWLWGKLCRGTS
jgi:predicted TIM-barrel fold metal-dependent hydrolase